MKALYSKYWALPLAIAMSLILFFFVGDVVLNANDFLYQNSGDSLKNYFHFAAYSKYGGGFHLHEVNYPYGEHIVFLDNQPAIAFIVNKMSLHNFCIGVIHLLPIISLLFTSILIFLIQRYLGLPLVFNVFSSIIITLMSPQLIRFPVHQSLSYTFIIPLTILLLLYAHRSNVYFLFIGVLAIFSAFTHLYFLLILIVLCVAYGFMVLLSKKNISYFILSALSVIIPLIAFQIIMSLTDNVSDRPKIPSGGASYRSTFEGVFLPQQGGCAQFLQEKFKLKLQDGERVAYVGKLGLPVLAFTLIVFLYRVATNKSVMSLFHNRRLFELCWAACFVWLFAMHFPFLWAIKFLGNHIESIKQFRSLGRLGWVFFYVFSIFMSFKFYFFYQFVLRRFGRNEALIFIGLIFMLWGSDINNNFSHLIKNYNNRSGNIFSKGHYNYRYKPMEEKIEFNKFQASLALPIFHMGSEIRVYEGSHLSTQEVFAIAYFYKLPFISTFSSRVSEQQLIAIEKISQEYSLKHLALNDKPFLIVADMNMLSKVDSVIIMNSTYLYQKDNIAFFQHYH